MDFNQFYKETEDPQREKWKGTPHGRIQWKGTDVCIDVLCVCGDSSHIDADFFYNFECSSCHRKYAVDSHVALVELTPEQIAFVESGEVCGFVSDTLYPVVADDVPG